MKTDNRVIIISAIVRNLSKRELAPALKAKITSLYPGLAEYIPVYNCSCKTDKEEITGNGEIKKQEFQLNVVLQEIKAGIEKILKTKKSPKPILSLTITDPDPTRSITTEKEIFVQIIRNLLMYMVKVAETGHVEFGYHIEKGINPLFFVRDYSREITNQVLTQSYHNLNDLSMCSSSAVQTKTHDLVFTQELVGLLNGNIWAKSGSSGNLVFYFHVGKEKFISHATIHEHEEERAMETIEWASKNVLVVEDLPNNYLYIETILRKTGANLLHVTNGTDALEMIKSEQPVDLILMDIRLPGMDGYETTIKIRKIKSHIPVIAVTAYSIRDEGEKIRKAGIDGYVSKPICSDDLISTMNQVMRRTPRGVLRLKKWSL